ncbi:MAG: hypothetical protein ABRQ38_06645 [Candidatus Eremiobacterota bacterium]
MKKMMISLIIITMCLAIFPACASIQVMQFDNSLVLPQDQLGIAINNNAVGTYTVANYQNTLFIDSTFFKYYFGVTEDQIKENVSYGGMVGTGKNAILCVPFLPVLTAMGLQYTSNNVAGKTLIAITVPVDSQQPGSGQSENVTYNTYNTTPPATVNVDVDDDPDYYPVGLGLATGIAIGAALDYDYYSTHIVRCFDVDRCYVTPYTRWNRSTFYNGSVYHAGTTGWTSNSVVHRGTTWGANGWVNHSGATAWGDNGVVHAGSTWGPNGNVGHAGATWRGADGDINHAGRTWGSGGGGGFHRGRR